MHHRPVALRALVLFLVLMAGWLPSVAPAQVTPETAPANSTAPPPAATPRSDSPRRTRWDGAQTTIQVEQLRSMIGMIRALMVGLLVLSIQSGFLLVAVGLTRSKNVSHTSGQILLTFAVSTIGFWAFGFALMYGGVGSISSWDGSDVMGQMVSVSLGGKPFGLLGLEGFFLARDSETGVMFWLFLLQMGFLATATAIPTGSLAERWRLRASCLFALATSVLIYPVFGCWVWGGGWLATLGTQFGIGNGFVDFAGSGVVHLTGGVLALVGSWILGPRIGKFRKDGMPNPIPGHNIPMVVIGSLLLSSAWIALAAGGGLIPVDLGVGPMAVRALLAAVAGCLGSCVYAWMFFGKPDPTLCCNGLLAGTVAIAAPCAFVSPVGAVVIGGLAGLMAIGGILSVERILKVDDPVGAIGVHGVCGAFGCLCVGLFATGQYGKGWNGVTDATPLGFFYGGGFSQLIAQAVGVVANVLWVAPTAYVAFRLINLAVGNRVLARFEVEGLDIPETGVLGYVIEETYVVATAGQIHLASHGPGVPERSTLGVPSKR